MKRPPRGIRNKKVGFTKSGPSAMYEFVYTLPAERSPTGRDEFRHITVPVGQGRFRRGSFEEAQELAERRLTEQFPDGTNFPQSEYEFLEVKRH